MLWRSRNRQLGNARSVLPLPSEGIKKNGTADVSSSVVRASPCTEKTQFSRRIGTWWTISACSTSNE